MITLMTHLLKNSTKHLMVVTLTILNLVLHVLVSGEVINLPLRRFSGHDFVKHRTKRDTGSIVNQRHNLEGKPGQGYYLEANIGSSNFAIAASPNQDITKYFSRDKSSSYIEIGTEVYVPYTQGNWKGVLGTDLVTLTSLPNVQVRSNIAFITHSSNFFINGSNWQGILGLAYSQIARTLGGLDSTLYTGQLYYTNIYKEWYYEVTIVDIDVNGQSLKMDCKEYNFPKTIVDSGTTNLRLPDKVFNQVVARIKQYTSAQGAIPPSDAFWDGNDNICWKENSVPYSTVLGAVVMEGYYVVFDRENKKIGFAESTCPVRDKSVIRSIITGPFKATGNLSDCAYVKVENDDSALTVVAYIMAGICCVCLLPLIVMVIHWQCRKKVCNKNENRHSDTNDLMTDTN
ncbi:hypothetical protein KUTeg_006372 [Tegillarca granosa]|uniref:Peptidase A1 domain-containing protein n=1 Tax=Tegillarca granosa TaxID=220873 RepID=A0ABQ9FGA3_TEGGR|nr:hypothetical protein KUTeg_006372 [Tegillarca granosa]